MITSGLRLQLRNGTRLPQSQIVRTFHASTSRASQNNSSDTKHGQKSSDQTPESDSKPAKKKKTLAEIDEEMRLAMEGHSGDGGLAGAELEGGKAVSMKRGVKDNMFRYI